VASAGAAAGASCAWASNGSNVADSVKPNRVVTLVADDRSDVVTLPNADEELLRGERTFRHTAKTLEPEEPMPRRVRAKKAPFAARSFPF
jgi:hypothetical protein